MRSDYDYMRPTDFERTRAQQVRFLLFGICVAGKRSAVIAEKLRLAERRLYSESEPSALANALDTPEYEQDLAWRLDALVQDPERFERACKRAGLGKYQLLRAAAEEVARRFAADALWIDHAGLDELLSIPGVGPKTARFFLVHSRRGARHIILDVHILATLGELGMKVPKATPPEPRYSAIEREAIALLESQGIRDLHSWDIDRWRQRAAKEEG